MITCSASIEKWQSPKKCFWRKKQWGHKVSQKLKCEREAQAGSPRPQRRPGHARSSKHRERKKQRVKERWRHPRLERIWRVFLLSSGVKMSISHDSVRPQNRQSPRASQKRTVLSNFFKASQTRTGVDNIAAPRGLTIK